MNFPDFYNLYFNARIKKKPDSTLVDKYLSKQDNLKTEIAWRIMNLFESGSYYDKYILEHLEEFTDLYGVEARIKANDILNKILKSAIASSDKNQYLYALNIMGRNNFKEQRLLETKIVYHLEFEDYSAEFAELLKNYFSKYSNILLRVCDSLFNKRDIKSIDEILSEQLEYKISSDANSIWRLYKALFKEKMSDLKQALPFYDAYLQHVSKENKSDALQKLIIMREKLNSDRNR
jgi:hypothetical protein